MFLSKNGWGLKEMIIVSGILILFLGLAIYNIYTIKTYFNNREYYSLENMLLEQSEIYLSSYNNLLTNEGIIVSNTDLDITLKDNGGNFCKGYVKITKSRGIINKTPYISCDKYETLGYEDWRI